MSRHSGIYAGGGGIMCHHSGPLLAMVDLLWLRQNRQDPDLRIPSDEEI